MSDEAGGGLSRWSQRKHAARLVARGSAGPAALQDADDRAEHEAAVPSAARPAARAEADVAAGEPREATGTPADARPPLPPIEELTAESDYTRFLADDVPEALKQAALRKLWTSDPVLACVDGLNHYDEDFSVVEELIATVQTEYKVGRGYLDPDQPEAIEMADERREIGHGAGPDARQTASESESAPSPAEVMAEDVDPSTGDDRSRPATGVAEAAEAPDRQGDSDDISKG